MSAVVAVAPDLLAELERRLRGLKCDVGTAVSADFSRSGEVGGAYSSVMGKWTKSRQEINEGLVKIADIVKAIRDAFVDADHQLAGALGPGDAGSKVGVGAAAGAAAGVTVGAGGATARRQGAPVPRRVPPGRDSPLIGAPTGTLPGADRTWQEVDRSYKQARGLGSHTYGANRDHSYQCTAWAKLRWQELGYDGDLSGRLGDGKDMSANLGGTTDTPMRLGSIVSRESNNSIFGHVMVVEEISADGTRARVSEWNNGDASGRGNPDEFRAGRWLTKSADGTWEDSWARGKPLTIANFPQQGAVRGLKDGTSP